MTKRMPRIDVHLVRTADDVAQFMGWLDEASRAGEAIAIDTETTGLAWWNYRFTRLLQFGTADCGYAIPIDWWGKVCEAAMQLLVDRRTTCVFHNAKFDLHAIEVEGYPLPAWSEVEDTAALYRLHRSDLSARLKSKHTAELLGGWIFRGQDDLMRVGREKYGLKTKADVFRYIPVDEEAYWVYGVMDTVITRLAYDEMLATKSEFPIQYQREMHYQAVMYRAEKRGIPVDEKYTLQLREKMNAEIERDLFYLQAAGVDNPNSDHQFLALLEEDFDFVPWQFTPTGQPSLNKGVLAVLAKAGGMQAEVVETLVRYKRNVKWRGTYLDKFLSDADLRGYVHPSINTMAARTGRSSVTYFPLQTLPSGDPMIRRCMLPPKGHVWYSIDFSNQEPRTLAHYGRSPELLRYFTEGDGSGSVHDFVAGEMFGSTYTKDQRSMAKIFGLSRSYGAGAESMAVASGLPLREVEAILPRYDQLVGLTALNDMVYKVAEDRMPTPYIVTGGGRRVYADEDKVYTLVNYLMQGTGADALKIATNNLDAEGLADYIMIPVHDEITFGFPKDEAEGMAKRAAEIMEEAAESVCPSLPFPVDIEGPAKSWGAIYE